MDAWDSLFVVFGNPIKQAVATLPKVQEIPLATLNGPWQVTFQANRGAPGPVEFQHLTSWSSNSDAGIKFFSGSADYTTKLFLSRDSLEARDQLLIDLGEVHDLATLMVNGQTIGTVWDRPYRLDITKSLHPGENIVRIKVTNMWTNRSIGDAQPNARSRYFTGTSELFADGAAPAHAFRPEARLRPAGLLGPVTVLRRRSSKGSP
jgi:hypothetical protein